MTSIAFKNAIKYFKKKIFLWNVTLPVNCDILIAFSYSVILLLLL